MIRPVLLLLLVSIGAVLCDPEYEEVQLNSFEGSYSLPDGGFMHLCQDGNKVQGSWNDLGLLQGSLSQGSLNGNFYCAGVGPCVNGTFNFALVPYGLEGFYVCSAHPGAVTWTAIRTSSFRPTDSQCSILSTSHNLQGSWVNDEGLFLDLCFVNSEFDPIVASLQKINSAGETISWYVDGYFFSSGRIATGTWYQNFQAGGILFFLTNDGQVNYFWWTGLLFNEGQTYIDINQLNDPALHGRGTYHSPPGFQAGGSTVSSRCTANNYLAPLVLGNLPEDDDDNFYYFVDTVNLLDQYFAYVEFTTLESSGCQVVASLLVLAVSFIVLFF